MKDVSGLKEDLGEGMEKDSDLWKHWKLWRYSKNQNARTKKKTKSKLILYQLIDQCIFINWLYLFALRVFYKTEINLKSWLHATPFLCYQTEDNRYLSKQVFLCRSLFKHSFVQPILRVFYKKRNKLLMLNSVNQLLLRSEFWP